MAGRPEKKSEVRLAAGALGSVVATLAVVSGVVKNVNEDGIAQIELTALCRGEKVLAQARAMVTAAALEG